MAAQLVCLQAAMLAHCWLSTRLLNSSQKLVPLVRFALASRVQPDWNFKKHLNWSQQQWGQVGRC